MENRVFLSLSCPSRTGMRDGGGGGGGSKRESDFNVIVERGCDLMRVEGRQFVRIVCKKRQNLMLWPNENESS